MKKRIAYLGLSYPVGYDYGNMASMSSNDLSDSPNPIIESPLGLMILYDELWFLCESMCPSNMRNLPYVKFVDKKFSDFYFGGAETFIKNNHFEVDDSVGLSFQTIMRRMNVDNRWRVDNHTHALKLGDITVGGNCDLYNFTFDIYVVTALQELIHESIELVANSRLGLRANDDVAKDLGVVEKIIIPNMPNYLSVDGPYHACMEELRENKYLIAFRQWIMDNHSSIQQNEIEEITCYIKNTIDQTKNDVFKRYLDDNSKFKASMSTGKTLLVTSLGVPYPVISIMDAVAGITMKADQACNMKNSRWQGFVIDAQDIARKNRL